MPAKSPPEPPSDEDTSPSPTPAAGEALDLGLVGASVVSLALTYYLIAWAELTGLFAVASIISADVVLVFLVVPHLMARWLGHDVDALLGETPSKPG